MNKSSSVAVFIDVENIHYSTLNNYAETPDWSWVVDACKAYGRIASIQAFGDWIEFSKEVPEIQKNGIQPVFVPLSQDGKSSLDCYLTVSAMKLFFQNKTVDTFILASGDRDYIPLIAELKAMGTRVVILAVPNTLSKDLTRIVDDVISYKSKVVDKDQATTDEHIESGTGHEFVVSVLKELEATSVYDRWVNLAHIGLELKKRDPSFTHNKYGYTRLAEMLDDISQIELKYDNYEKTIALARTKTAEQMAAVDEALAGVIANIKEGYGFIKPDKGESNIFFHYSKVINGTFKDLAIGDRVSYREYNTNRGVNAENISKLAT